VLLGQAPVPETVGVFFLALEAALAEVLGGALARWLVVVGEQQCAFDDAFDFVCGGFFERVGHGAFLQGWRGFESAVVCGERLGELGLDLVDCQLEVLAHLVLVVVLLHPDGLLFVAVSFLLEGRLPASRSWTA